MSGGKTNFTSGMEKAMYQSHGVSYNVYNQSLKDRLKVEAKREINHKQGNKFAGTQSHH